MPIHSSNSAEIARRLESHDMVEKVIHTSLRDPSDYDMAQGAMPNGGGMLAFVIQGRRRFRAGKFARALNTIFEATSQAALKA